MWLRARARRDLERVKFHVRQPVELMAFAIDKQSRVLAMFKHVSAHIHPLFLIQPEDEFGTNDLKFSLRQLKDEQVSTDFSNRKWQ